MLGSTTNPQRYVLQVSLKQKREIQNSIAHLKPSEIVVGQVEGYWIQATNVDVDFGQWDVEYSGKLIIKLPRGSSAVDAAWEKVVAGVRQGVIMDAKVAPINPDFEDQVICVYTKSFEDKAEIKRIFDFLLDGQQIELQAIKGYKKDYDTIKGPDELTYTAQEIMQFSVNINASKPAAREQYLTPFRDSARFSLNQEAGCQCIVS